MKKLVLAAFFSIGFFPIFSQNNTKLVVECLSDLSEGAASTIGKTNVPNALIGRVPSRTELAVEGAWGAANAWENSSACNCLTPFTRTVTMTISSGDYSDSQSFQVGMGDDAQTRNCNTLQRDLTKTAGDTRGPAVQQKSFSLNKKVDKKAN